MEIKQVDNEKILINKRDVLRFLSYKADSLDSDSQKIFDESLEELKDISRSLYVYDVFDLEKDDKNSTNKISLINTDIVFESNSLQKFYRNSSKTAVFATTLGFEVEKRIKYYSVSNLSKAVIFDALSSAFIEGLCDIISEEIKMKALIDGFTVTPRFSPGYGDVPISHQHGIIKALNAKKLIGIDVLESSLLLPQKSVTALIGLIPLCKVCKA